VAMNAELRRQEEEERRQAEERREAREAASRIPTAQQSLQALWDRNGAAIYEANQAALKAVKTVPAAVKKVGYTVASSVKKVATTVKKAVYSPISTTKKSAPVVKAATPVVKTTPAKTNLWGSLTSAVKKIVTPIVNTVKKVVTPVVSTVKKVVTPIVNTVKKVVTPVVNTVKKVVTPVVNTVKKVVAPVVNTVKKVVAPVVNVVKKVVTPIVNTVKAVVTPIVNTAISTLNAGTTALTGILSPAKEAGGGAKLAMPTPVKKDDDPWYVQFWNWLTGRGNPPQTTPTPDVNAIQTSAIQTIMAQIVATMTANAPMSTVTPLPTIIPTITPIALPTSLWVTINEPVFHIGDPNGPKGPDLPYRSVVFPTGNTQPAVVDGKNVLYKEVRLLDGTTGWVVSNYLEGVVTSSSSLIANPDKKVVINPALSYINTALTNPADTPAQYLSLKGTSLSNGIIEAGTDIKTNLCGPFSVAYVTGRPIETVLSDWITKSSDTSAAKNNIIKNDATGVNDIKGMLDLYHCTYTKEV